LFRLYAAAASSSSSTSKKFSNVKKNHGGKVQKVPLCSECCTAHTTGTIH